MERFLFIFLLFLTSCVYQDFSLSPKPDIKISKVALSRYPIKVVVESDLRNGQMVGYRRFNKLKLEKESIGEGIIYYNNILKTSIKGSIIAQLEDAGIRVDENSPYILKVKIDDIFVRSYASVKTTFILSAGVSLISKGKTIYVARKDTQSFSTSFLWAYSNEKAQEKINTEIADLISEALNSIFASEDFISKLAF